MGLPRFLGLVLLVSACGINRRPIDARHEQRAAEVNARYDEQQRQNDAQWYALWQQLEGLRQQLVRVNAHGEPIEPLRPAFEPLWQACTGRPDEAPCTSAASNQYVQALAARYTWADFDWVADQLERLQVKPSIEFLVATSHNARLGQTIANLEHSLREDWATSRAMLESARQGELEASEAERDYELAVAEQQRRRRLAAIGQAMQTVGQGMQRSAGTYSSAYARPSPMPASTTTRAPTERGCSSDFECGVGNTCVKANYSATGTCMRAVNEYGTPTYDLPRLDSVQVKTPSPSDCQLGSCPIGFTCDVRSGACIKGGGNE